MHLEDDLLKRSKHIHTWKKRRIVLINYHLQVYNKKGIRKNDYILSSIGNNNSNSSSIIIRLFEQPRQYGFVIFLYKSSSQERIYLAADSDTQRQKWVNALLEQCNAKIDDTLNEPPKSPPENNNTNIIPNEDTIAPLVKNINIRIPQKVIIRSPTIKYSNNEENHNDFNTCAKNESEEILQLSPISLEKSKFSPINNTNNDLSYLGPALTEYYSQITFPTVLSSGDSLIGVGPVITKRTGCDKIFAVAMYVNAEQARIKLVDYNGITLEKLYNNEEFYSMLLNSTFRMSFVLSCRKRTSKNIILSFFLGELEQRLFQSSNTIYSDDSECKQIINAVKKFVDKSLKKGESIMFVCQPDGTLEWQYRRCIMPPISSMMLCQALKGMFFDNKSIQSEARYSLIERIPTLWEDIKKQNYVTTTKDNDVVVPKRYIENRLPDTFSIGLDSEVKKKDINLIDDNVLLDALPIKPNCEIEKNISLNFNIKLRQRLFTSIIESNSNTKFKGIINGDYVLLGVSSLSITNTANVTKPISSKHTLDAVGLYVKASQASRNLIKYKGLSTGSILMDPEFVDSFMNLPFERQLNLYFCPPFTVLKFSYIFKELFDPQLHETKEVLDIQNKLQNILASYNKSTSTTIEQISIILCFRILDKNNINLTANLRRVDDKVISEFPVSSISSSLGLAFQNIIYGHLVNDISIRECIFQRIPSLLDTMKEEMVIHVPCAMKIKSSDVRYCLPGNSTKCGFLEILKVKRRRARHKISLSWSTKWCKLEGDKFSYYTYRRNKTPHESVILGNYTVTNLSNEEYLQGSLDTGSIGSGSHYTAEKQSFQDSNLSYIIIGLIHRHEGEKIILRALNRYEGTSWLNALLEASKLAKPMPTREQNIILTSNELVKESHIKGYLLDETIPDNYDRKRYLPAYGKGSLLSWIFEDKKNFLIILLTILLLWVLSLYNI